MNYRILFCLLAVFLLVGVVSADTAIIRISNETSMYVTKVSSAGTEDTAFYNAHAATTSTCSYNGLALYIMYVWNRTPANLVYLYRSGQIYNTSLIGSASTITSATLRMAGLSESTVLGSLGATVADWSPANINNPICGDWDSTTYTLYSSSNLTAATHVISAGANNFTLNAAGIAAINKNGNSPFYFMGMNDIDNSTTGITWAPDASSTLREYGATAAVEANRPTLIIEYIPGGAPSPIASFITSKNFIRIPNTVTVTDTSTGNPTSWQWLWGDGSANSTTQNPSHQYLKRGKFNIFMTATNAGGDGATGATSIRVVGYENYY